MNRLNRVLLVACACGAIVAGCGTKSDPDSADAPGAQADANSAENIDAYDSRGVVVSLPIAGQPATSFQIHHEALPGFQNKQGEVVGMGSMQMPFPLGEGVSIDELTVGDKVSFRFEVRRDTWRYAIVSIERLSGDTELDFGAVSSEP